MHVQSPLPGQRGWLCRCRCRCSRARVHVWTVTELHRFKHNARRGAAIELHLYMMLEVLLAVHCNLPAVSASVGRQHTAHCGNGRPC
jgi:hypothetical protein